MNYESETINSSTCKQLRKVRSDMSDHEAGNQKTMK